MSAEIDSLDPLPEVMRVTGLARPTIYKFIRSGAFPSPVKCGTASRWSRSEIQGWIAARKAERDAGAKS